MLGLNPNKPPAFSASVVSGPKRFERSPSCAATSPIDAIAFIAVPTCGMIRRNGSSISSSIVLMRVDVLLRLSTVDARFSRIVNKDSVVLRVASTALPARSIGSTVPRSVNNCSRGFVEALFSDSVTNSP